MFVDRLAVVILSLLIKAINAFGHCDAQYGYDVELYESNMIVNFSGNRTNNLTNWNLVNTNPSLGTLYQSKGVFCVPPDCGSGIQLSGIVRYEGLISGSTMFTTDPQYGYALFGLSGFDGFQFAFWITNNKIYALYSRLPNSQTTLEYYLSGTYLIPIADRTSSSQDLLEIWLDASNMFVSWRMNEFELLRVKKPGDVCIDSKFMIADYGGYYDYSGFPEQVVVQVGALRPDPSTYTGSPHPACQGALFNDCLDDLCVAKKAQCTYVQPISNPRFVIQSVAQFQQVSITTRSFAQTCPQWTCDLQNMDQCPPADCPVGDVVVSCGCVDDILFREPSRSETCVPDWPYQQVDGRLAWQKPPRQLNLKKKTF